MVIDSKQLIYIVLENSKAAESAENLVQAAEMTTQQE